MKNTLAKSVIRRSLSLLTLIICFNYSSAQDLEVAKLLTSAYVSDSCRDTYLFDKAEAKYLLVLEIDSMNLDANLGLAQLYKNRAISISKNIESNKETWTERKIIKEVAKAREYLKKGRPFMDRFNRLDSKTHN